MIAYKLQLDQGASSDRNESYMGAMEAVMLCVKARVAVEIITTFVRNRQVDFL